MSHPQEPDRTSAAGSSAARGLAAGAACGALVGVIISAYNPFFVDSLLLGIVFLWAVPAALGAILWTLGGAIARLARRRRGGAAGSSPARRATGGRRAPIALLLLAAIVVGLYLARHLNERAPAADGPHALVIGMDGATWDIMDPMMERGELPNLAAIRNGGASGVLTSISPTLSPAVWTTLATGKVRAKHGVMDFSYTQEDLRVPRIWELLEGEGKKVGMMCWLLTWPPAVRNGFMVPGWLARTPATYPESLHFALDIILGEGLARTPREYLAYITDAPRIGVRLSTLFEALKLVSFSKLKKPPKLDLIYRKDMLKAKIYADIFRSMLSKERPDFAAVVFYGTDSLAHGYWKYMAALDASTGSAVGGAAPGGVDSSAGPRNGRPTAGGEAPSARNPGPASDSSASARAATAGWDVSPEDARRYGEVIRDYYRLVDSLLPGILKLMPGNTTVCVVSDHGHGPSGADWGYLVPKANHLIESLGLADVVSVASVGDWTFLSPAPGRGPEALAQAVELLSSLKIAGLDTPFLSIEVKRSATFSLRINEGVNKSDSFAAPDGRRFSVADYVDKTDLSGTHRLGGVVMLSGEGVKSGCTVKNASILDITPTLLYLMGSTVGEDMDGRVLTGCIEPGYLERNPIATVKSRNGEVPLPGTGKGEEMPEAVRKRLRDLGYVK